MATPFRQPSLLTQVLLGIATALVIAASILYAKSETILLGAQTWLFGYPLVLMDVTRSNAAQAIGPENELKRVRQFPDHNFREVVRPNVDTLYTTSFIDTGKGPWVFDMPANAERFELMPFMDAWTNVFAVPGTRSTGTSGGRFLLVAPRWQGKTPEGMTLLRAPTRMVWLIGRTQTNGPEDFPRVHRLQDGLQLRHLDEWLLQKSGLAANVPAIAGPAGATTSAAWAASPVKPVPPVAQMQSMSTQTFLGRLTALLPDNPPPAADAPMMEKLARLGIAPGRPPETGTVNGWAISLGRWIAERKIASELTKPRELVQGWQTPPAILGRFGTAYDIRAVVAMVGLGANLPEDAIYPSARFDDKGEPLHGSRKYRLRFKPSSLPPVNAFWSVTAYGRDDFLIENPLRRYALGDRDELRFEADGSLELLIQATAPEARLMKNWLPVKPGEAFGLTARLYWPKPEVLNGRWHMPAVERID